MKSSNSNNNKSININKEQEQNKKERFYFIKKWAQYVKESNNLEWSKQQNILINSQLQNTKNIKLTREQYLKIVEGYLEEKNKENNKQDKETN